MQAPRHRDSNLKLSNPVALHYSCAFLTGLAPSGMLVVSTREVCQYFREPCSGCYSHCFSCWEVNPESVHPARVGTHCFTYKPTLSAEY